MSLAKLTDEGLLKSLNARLVQKALCTLAERENWLLIVPPPPPPHPALPPPSLMYTDTKPCSGTRFFFPCSYTHTCTTQKPLGALSQFRQATILPSSFSFFLFCLFYLLSLSILPSPHFLSEVPTRSAVWRLQLLLPLVISLLILPIHLFLNISHFVSAQSGIKKKKKHLSHNIGYHMSY